MAWQQVILVTIYPINMITTHDTTQPVSVPGKQQVIYRMVGKCQ